MYALYHLVLALSLNFPGAHGRFYHVHHGQDLILICWKVFIIFRLLL